MCFRKSCPIRENFRKLDLNEISSTEVPESWEAYVSETDEEGEEKDGRGLVFKLEGRPLDIEETVYKDAIL